MTTFAHHNASTSKKCILKRSLKTIHKSSELIMEMSLRPNRRVVQSLNVFPVIIYGRFVEIKIIFVLLSFFFHWKLTTFRFTVSFD